jgi:hypothetical protein
MPARLPYVDSSRFRSAARSWLSGSFSRTRSGHAADIGNDAGVREPFPREEDSRSQCEAGCHPVRLGDHARGDAKFFLTNPDGIAEFDSQAQQQIVGNRQRYRR